LYFSMNASRNALPASMVSMPLIPLIELDARVGYLREKYKLASPQIDVVDPRVELPAILKEDLDGAPVVMSFAAGLKNRSQKRRL